MPTPSNKNAATNTMTHCPQCGGELASDAPSGLCPRCLMAAGFESDAVSGHDTGATTPHTPVSGSGRRFVPPSPADLAPHFPQLEILALLGSGGMGAVYKARQKELDRIVALKILPPQLGEDPSFAERFLREARAMARLSHPNIVAIFDFGRAGELCYFVMEFIDGTNLRQVIKTGKVESADALSLATQICDALEYAHEEGVVHRDVKPENILVSRLGRVKITDFGLAKVVLDAAQASALTGTAELLGTFRYMAPEQLEQSKTVDHRADIYALGIVLYELLTGEVPMGRFHPPSEKVKSDPRLDEIVLRALEQEPQRRFQRASEIKTALESIDSPVAGASSASTLTSRWTSGMWSGVWSNTRSRPANGWVVACRLLGMLVAFAGLMVASFMVWESVSIEMLERPANSQFGQQLARQSSLGWHTTPGKLAALAFGLVLLYLIANLQRLRWLTQTYAAFFLCGFAVIAFSAWSIARDPQLSTGSINWQTSSPMSGDWEISSQPSAGPATPREYLETLAGAQAGPADPEVASMSNIQLVELLARRGKLTLSSSYWADGPHAGMALGIGLAFVGLLEFVFTYAAEPTRRFLGSARSSVTSRFSEGTGMSEPRISKMAVLAALLGLLPMIPLIFLGTMGVQAIQGRGVDPEPAITAISFLIGLSVFPTTVGLFGVYRVRRSRGMLHGLPLAFAASITWPLVTFDVVACSVAIAASNERDVGLAVAFALFIALIFNVAAYALAWMGVSKPLDVAPPER